DGRPGHARRRRRARPDARRAPGAHRDGVRGRDDAADTAVRRDGRPGHARRRRRARPDARRAPGAHRDGVRGRD
ncbi:hypothetical protein CTI14_70515, partial [Methylobacterium radiotolerans]